MFNPSEEKLKEMFQNCIDHYTAYSNIMDNAVRHGGINFEHMLYELPYTLLDEHIKLLEQTAGDEYGNLAWYIFENDCGNRGFEAGEKGNNFKIKNLDDLFKLIAISSRQLT
jgi:hypothetical protein